jgi:hypothetical protein
MNWFGDERQMMKYEFWPLYIWDCYIILTSSTFCFFARLSRCCLYADNVYYQFSIIGV